jgi:hypothetical protein
MTIKEILIKEINKSPEPILEELLNYTLYLKIKVNIPALSKTNTYESAFAKDWLTKEEDEAWKNL